MIDVKSGDWSPGFLFLRGAERLFTDETVAALIRPAIADFQGELRETAVGPARRLAVRCRWYWALTTLFVIAPFTGTDRALSERASTREQADDGWLMLLFYVPLFASAWWCLQQFTAAAFVVGAGVAWALRAWHDRHPAVVVTLSGITAAQPGRADERNGTVAVGRRAVVEA